MSGHSKWATTKHKKAAADSKRGKAFTKLIKEITVAARMGGGDPDGNPRLRLAILKSKEQNMPADNIKRAVMKGTGELPGVSYEEILYEGYGPGGTAMLVEIMTDNKNRTVAEIRHIFSKHGGHMGEAGCVGWMFHKTGDILVEKSKADEETLMALALDAGADDMKSDDPEQYEILTAPGELERVKKALEAKGIPLAFAEATQIPQTYVKLEGKDAEQMLKLMEALEDHDDVQKVHANFDIAQDVMEKVLG
ncbi:MAG: YebC/PmpR family DNA-binding transcriptional regulator [Nitrospirae bacterium]|nr:YebC/PmpR family DNA-binding transcriptional regulator [Nitrospirota bacterium]